MRNTNGVNVCPKCKSVNITNDTRNVSNTSKLLTPPEIELLEFVGYLERPDLVKSLKLIHDLAIYHSDVAFDTKEKTALHDVRVLWEKIADMIEKV
jgi:hypothetical protein